MPGSHAELASMVPALTTKTDCRSTEGRHVCPALFLALAIPYNGFHDEHPRGTCNNLTWPPRRGKLSPGAVENIRTWLTAPYLAEYAPAVAEHIAAGKWQELDDAFWTTIPFGTGGRRGRLYPIGTNAINDRTIGESAQGLADYVVKQVGNKPLACAIAYDTRHRSRQFAELCAEIMAAAGFKV